MANMTGSSIVTQIINKTVVSWLDSEPLRWKASTKASEQAPEYNDDFDLSSLRGAFEEEFLIGMRDLLVGRHRQCKRRSVKGYVDSISRTLRAIQSKQVDPEERLVEGTQIAAIDIGLLTAMRAKLAKQPNWIGAYDLNTLKTLYKYAGEGSVYQGVSAGDFPLAGTGRPAEDILRSRIVAQALTRSAQIAVLKNIEDGFQNLQVDLALYTFWNLELHLFIRPESYRQITCGDLIVTEDKKSKTTTYILMVTPAKRGSLVPKPMPTELDKQMGELLLLQRESVIRQYGPLYGIDSTMPDEQRKQIESSLALFPRRTGLRKPFEIANFGLLETTTSFSNSYLAPLQRRLEGISVGFNVMRHTISTHLAAAGCSAQTIQAVLKHATDQTARVYVDLATKELKERLSQGLEGLPDLFPAYRIFTTQRSAKAIPIKAINSTSVDPETGELSQCTPGQCGGSKACDYAPLACYGCWRFIPAIDADHTLNLKRVQESIDYHKQMGRPFMHLLERDEVLKLNISFVIAECSRHRQKEATESFERHGG